MSKAKIHVPAHLLQYVPDPKLFAGIIPGPRFEYQGNKALGIDIVEGGCFPGDNRGLSWAHCQSDYLQTYLIYPREYSAVKRTGPNPYDLDPTVKVVFTRDIRHAVSYALGLLEKGALYGVWA